MLVLSRKSREAVVVGGSAGFQHQLKVTVIEIRGGCVKLGFEIDSAVPVHRWEVWERIRDFDPSGLATPPVHTIHPKPRPAC
ncbi:MAG: carbon storage regulator [Gemmataceae bacterium]